jgi:hypothetical protein
VIASCFGIPFFYAFETGKVLSNKLFWANNRSFANELMRASAHGIKNGASRLMSGGKFEHGFLSGGVYAEQEQVGIT